MTNQLENKTIGIIIFFFAIIFAITTFNWFQIILNMQPHDLLKVIFVASYIIILTQFLILIPLFAYQGILTIQIEDLFKGFIIFCLTSIIMIPSWSIFGTILKITGSGFWGSTMWLFYIVILIISDIIMPNYFILEGIKQ